MAIEKFINALGRIWPLKSLSLHYSTYGHFNAELQQAASGQVSKDYVIPKWIVLQLILYTRH